MNNTFNNLVIYNGYPLSVVVAILFHIFVLSVLLYLQSNGRTDVLNLVQPSVITALFIDENPQVRNEQNRELQRLERTEQEQQRQIDAVRERAQADAAAQQRAEETERERQQALLVEREELQRLQEAQARLERERESLENQRREREVVDAERARQEEANNRARQAEEAQAAALQAARTESQLVQSATGLIQQIVQENWSRPPSARNGMRAILQIRMLPTGELVEATITQSSGDPAFDRSAENAVYRAAPFTELQQLPISIFNTNFRSLSLIFEPEDLLN
ncbi:MAG: cell envelope integrity protein TolA [Gammaproteobacteria bacterium]|jgi:colicin import membrane protein|nr:cell envelope integrity protein TolA [Gammaproteobacteria bacterium]